jgi:hypothetical protein
MLKSAFPMNEQHAEKGILKALIEELKGVPFLKTRAGKANAATRNGARPYAAVEARAGQGRPRKLIVEIRKSGQPRYVREAANQLYRFTARHPNAYGIVGAPYISPAAAKICENEDVGYVDLAGNCRLVFDTIYIVREGSPNPFVRKRDLRSLYSPRATRVLRVLLNNPSAHWKTRPLADEAAVSLGQVANIRKLLRDREWITESKQGFRLQQPAELLQQWSDNYSFRDHELHDYYSMSDPGAIAVDLAMASVGCPPCNRGPVQIALTGLSGAARTRPGIGYRRVTAFVSELNDAFVGAAGLKRVSSGANVTLMVPYDEGVFYGTKEYAGVPVVSPVQLYLDLKSYKGRGEEAAQAIYEDVLRRLW